MDKILSARVDETIIQQINMLANRLRTSKKAVIEGAITNYAEKISKEINLDILEQTAGAWQRDETPRETTLKARQAMENSMRRRRE